MRGFINPSPTEIPSFEPKLQLAILASGKGSNFERILIDIKSNKLDANINLNVPLSIITNKLTFITI